VVIVAIVAGGYLHVKAASESFLPEEKTIANGHVETACSWTAKGNAYASAMPGTNEQLQGGVGTHNHVYPDVPVFTYGDEQTAERYKLKEIRVVEGSRSSKKAWRKRSTRWRQCS